MSGNGKQDGGRWEQRRLDGEKGTMKGGHLFQGGRFWTVSSHYFLHYVPDCDIITVLFNYSSSLWPKKIRAIMEQALSLLHCYISF